MVVIRKEGITSLQHPHRGQLSRARTLAEGCIRAADAYPHHDDAAMCYRSYSSCWRCCWAAC
jgi:hypothetical protein